MRKKPKSLSARLEFARGLAGLSASELGALAGLRSKGHVRLLETSKKPNPELKTIRQLCKVLGVRLAWLIEGEGDLPTEIEVRACVDAFKASLPNDRAHAA